MKQKIRGSIVALADGWTNWRHEKTMNFVIILSGVAIFWNTILSKYGKAAKTLFGLPKIAVSAIEKKYEVQVCSLVAENEICNKALFLPMNQWRHASVVVHTGCSSSFRFKSI